MLFDPQGIGHALGRAQFVNVALSIVETECKTTKPLGARDREASGRIEPTGEEHDRWFLRFHPLLFSEDRASRQPPSIALDKKEAPCSKSPPCSSSPINVRRKVN
jgi:hypothetical protein